MFAMIVGSTLAVITALSLSSSISSSANYSGSKEIMYFSSQVFKDMKDTVSQPPPLRNQGNSLI